MGRPSIALAISLPLLALVVGAQARAQSAEAEEPAAEPGDAEPGDAEPGDAEPGDAEPGDAEPGDAEKAKKLAAPDLSPEATREIAVLQTIEARLSVGDELSEAQKTELVRLATEGHDGKVRALAAAVLPWLGPGAVLEALLSAASDEDARVRAQALAGVVALARRLTPEQVERVRKVAIAALGDPSDEVACAGARLLVAVEAEGASEILENLADDAPDLRFGCFRQYAGLPMRDIEVDEPELPPSRVVEVPPEGEEPAPGPSLSKGLGGGIFLVTAGGAGVVAGGLLNGSLFPARDTLTYTARTTRHSREEPNILFGAGGALLGGAAFGAAAFGLQYLVGPLDFAPAVSVLGLTAAGAAGGYGLGLALNLEQPWQGLSVIGGTLAGFAVSAPVAYLLPPDERDLTLIASSAGAATLTGALVAFTVIPEGYDLLFDRVRRADFGTGVGLMAGSMGAVAALAASPLLDISHGRMLASAGAALGVGSAAMATGFLLPVAFDNLGLGVTRSRVASALALVTGWAAGTAVFVLLPASWASVFERVKAKETPSVVAVEDGALKLGVPAVWAVDVSQPGDKRTALGLDLFRGSF